MNSKKILTVVVPSYNMEAFLEKCLSSMIVAEPLMDKLEVLIVNDGSKDKTSAIGHAFEAKYPQTFRVIDKENGNYGSCIERGLAEASGYYIKTIDADDWVENFSEYLMFIDVQLHKQEAPDLILNDFEFVVPDKVKSDVMSYSFCDVPGFTVAGFDYRNGRQLWMHAVAYKSEKLRKIGYTQMHGVSYTDEEWISLPVTTVCTIAHFPNVVYKYFLGREGQTCDPAVYFRSYWMQMKILEKLISQYVDRQGTWGPDQEVYMRNHLLHRVMLTYRICLVDAKRGTGGDIVKFDEFLHNRCEWMYLASADFRLTNRCPIRYVALWRRNKVLSSLFIQLYRLGGLAVRYVRHMTRRAK